MNHWERRHFSEQTNTREQHVVRSLDGSGTPTGTRLIELCAELLHRPRCRYEVTDISFKHWIVHERYIGTEGRCRLHGVHEIGSSSWHVPHRSTAC